MSRLLVVALAPGGVGLAHAQATCSLAATQARYFVRRQAFYKSGASSQFLYHTSLCIWSFDAKDFPNETLFEEKQNYLTKYTI